MTGAADHDLAGIIASAAAGDEVAFRRIAMQYQDELYSICVFVCRDRSMAEEAVQSAWSIVWRKIGSVREQDKLRPWLVRNLERLVIQVDGQDGSTPVDVTHLGIEVEDATAPWIMDGTALAAISDNTVVFADASPDWSPTETWIITFEDLPA